MAKRKFSAMDQVTGEYEVFLSFSGEDTRKGFTDFLYNYLVDASIRTFRDNNELRVGEEISPKLLKAIKESKISIPIFSKKYASSKYCLLELDQMVECMEKKRQKIFPIFYDVDPHEVKHQSGSYKSAFCKHQENFDKMTVQRWKEAMRKVGHIKGLELKKETNGFEGELVRKVVQAVLIGLEKNYTQLPDNLVGIDDHVKAMKELLDVDSNGVRVVGIHGMGGLGKTTIAKVIYNQLCEGFEGCCFLEDVRANSGCPNGIIDLQTQLLSKIQTKKADKIYNVDEGINKIKNAVGMKKVFIVLDDVDGKSQFDNLVGKCDVFGVGTRIIVTTRNKEVLDTLEATYQTKYPQDVYGSYEPPLMNPSDSLELFCKCAFMRDSPPEDYDNLAQKVVSSAGGLPLVLVTIGSSLFGMKKKALWEEKFRKLEKIPHKEVLDKLRISFVALNHEEQQIFLDIACFFIGKDLINPCYMWDACGFYPRDGLNGLVLRHMVKIEDDNTPRMHDQLRDLGRQIVREENMAEPGKRSRLWSREDALDLWERRMVTEKVEALNLDLGEDSSEVSEFGSQCLVGEDFGQLRNLRFLKLGQADLDGDFNRHLSNLKWLDWDCPGNFWPSNCHLRKLVILDLSGGLRSQVTDNWKGWSEIEKAKGLKVLTLRRFFGLRRAPIFSKFTTLERLSLCVCHNLEEINPSIQDLTNLRVLDLSNCSSLRTFDCSAFSSLENLNLSGCTKLRRLDGLEKLESLRYLDMSDCWSLEILLDLSKFKKLEKLDMFKCWKIIKIQGLDRLDSIEFLDMMYCNSIERLPGLSNLRMLKKLILWYCSNLREIEDFGVLESLEDLDMKNCESIERLPDLSKLGKLKRLCLHGCDKLREVEGLGVLESLEDLDMFGCKSIERLPDLSKLGKIKRLCLHGCEKLHEVEGLGVLESLEDLDMTDCKSIERLTDLSKLGKLKRLCLRRCEKLREVEGLGVLESLEVLDLSYCNSMEKLDLLKCKKLEKIEINGCHKIIEIQLLERLDSIEFLNMTSCSSIERLTGLSNLRMLKELNLNFCWNLRELGEFGVLESLEHLEMRGCESIKRLPDLSKLGKLKRLHLDGCEKLREVEGLGVLELLESLDLSYCNLLKEILDLSNLKNLKKLSIEGLEDITEIRGLEKLKSLTELDIAGCRSLGNLPDLPNTRISRTIRHKTVKSILEMIRVYIEPKHGWINKIRQPRLYVYESHGGRRRKLAELGRRSNARRNGGI